MPRTLERWESEVIMKTDMIHDVITWYDADKILPENSEDQRSSPVLVTLIQDNDPQTVRTSTDWYDHKKREWIHFKQSAGYRVIFWANMPDPCPRYISKLNLTRVMDHKYA